MEKLFLYQLKDCEERDKFAYIENGVKFVCNHYFSSPSPEGACYSGGGFADYEDIITILTKQEYLDFLKFSKDVKSFGYGIEKNSEKYNECIEVINNHKYLYDKLKSTENEKLFNKLLSEDWDRFKKENCLNDEDIKNIKENYCGDYKDSSIVSDILDDIYSYAKEFIDDTCNIEEWIKQYIDFEEMGKDLLEDRGIELNNGKVIVYNY